jgi:hypothetical protein
MKTHALNERTSFSRLLEPKRALRGIRKAGNLIPAKAGRFIRRFPRQGRD